MSPTPLDQLDLPEFPMPGPEIRGEAWHEMMDGIIEHSAADGVWLARNPTDSASMRVFGFSITYVTLLFGAMTVDILV